MWATEAHKDNNEKEYILNLLDMELMTDDPYGSMIVMVGEVENPNVVSASVSEKIADNYISDNND